MSEERRAFEKKSGWSAGRAQLTGKSSRPDVISQGIADQARA